HFLDRTFEESQPDQRPRLRWENKDSNQRSQTTHDVIRLAIAAFHEKAVNTILGFTPRFPYSMGLPADSTEGSQSGLSTKKLSPAPRGDGRGEVPLGI
ncbi:MAG: hypothetical protein AAF357_08350, partial [Verrucomicrobiota bacterium]